MDKLLPFFLGFGWKNFSVFVNPYPLNRGENAYIWQLPFLIY